MSEALELVERMVDALNEHVIEGQEEFWSEDMVWHGPAGIGTKHGLTDFQENHQKPFLHAFPDKLADDQIRFGTGQWVAAAGTQRATHNGEWLGIPASGAQVEVRYMDIWRAHDGQLVENWVLIDILGFLEQLGYDVGSVLRFIGSKPPSFFEESDPLDREDQI
ncbi:MAG: ester cyclase [Actinobacteria bacterium]|nr:ester cyclase [Actinomycetota bacterium]